MTDDIERLLRRLVKNRFVHSKTGCWIWTGTRDKDGYGRTLFRGKPRRVSRIMAWLVLGSELEPTHNNQALHKCSSKSCFNPAHLKVGSRSENNRDIKDQRGTCKNGHPFTSENTYLYLGIRHCRICTRGGQRRRYWLAK